jgi:hypothetical protein
MDNRHLVTRHLGRVPSKNHHDDWKSTPPKFFAAHFFRSVGPIRAAPEESIVLQISPAHRKN